MPMGCDNLSGYLYAIIWIETLHQHSIELLVILDIQDGQQFTG